MAKKEESKEVVNTEQETVKEIRKIYCGPNIPGGLLMQYTIFKGEPEYLNRLFGKCNAIKELMVPVSELNVTRKNVETMGTYENTLFNEIVEFIKGGAN